MDVVIAAGGCMRECIGASGTLQFDAKQRWSLPVPFACPHLMVFLVKSAVWIEELRTPDDVHGHAVTGARD